MRDSQRSKVYRAERIMERSVRDQQKGSAMSIAECQAYVDKVLGSAYVQRRFGWHPGKTLPVHATHGGGRAAYSGSYHRDRSTGEFEWRGAHIRLGVWARQPYVILHEIAHHLTGIDKGHGWEFCATVLDLTRHFLGQEAHDILLASFNNHKVRFRQPMKRTITPERREQLRIQLAAARAAKEARAVG